MRKYSGILGGIVFLQIILAGEDNMDKYTSDIFNWTSVPETLVKIQTDLDGRFIDKAPVKITISPDNGGISDKDYPYIYANNPLLRRAVFELPKDLNWKNYNTLSCDVYPDIPDRASVWLEIEGAPKWTSSCGPLKPRKWNKVAVSWLHIKPEDMKKSKKLHFMFSVNGRLPGDPEWNTYYVSNLKLEYLPPRTEETWQANPNHIIVSQTGFSPHDMNKTGILSPDIREENFELIDSKTRESVFRGNLQKIETPVGIYKIADFSEFSRKGSYRIKCGKLESVNFPIRENVYLPLLEKGMYYFKCSRSGCATPVHAECFLDDAIREDNKEHVDISGGWFDASDLRSYISMMMCSITRPFALTADSGTCFDFDKDGKDDLTEETAWGAKLLAKIWDEKTGLPFTVHCLFPRPDEFKKLSKIGKFYLINNTWTDNITGTADDRTVHVPWMPGAYACHADHLDFHLGITLAGAYFKIIAPPEHRETALKAFAKCERHFNNLLDPEFRKKSVAFIPKINRLDLIGVKSLFLENAIAFWKATGDKKYKELALKMAGEIIEQQSMPLIKTNSGHYLSGFFNGYSMSLEHSMPISCIVDLIKEFPDFEKRLEYIARLKIYSEFYIKTRGEFTEPYGMPVMDIYKEKNPAGGKVKNPIKIGHFSGDNSVAVGNFRNSFSSGWLGIQSYEELKLAALFNDVELEQAAVKTLRWQTGENPFARSMIADIGEDFKTDIFSTALGFIPGMMANCEFHDNMPFMPMNRQYAKNEIYTQTHAPYLLAAASLCKPAVFEGQIRFDGNARKNLPVKVINEVTKELHSQFETDENGNFKNISVPGGAAYIFDLGNGKTLKRAAISGKKSRLVIDLKKTYGALSVSCPVRARSGTPFKAVLKAEGGTVPDVSIFAFNAKTEKLNTNIPNCIEWNITPISKNMPFSLLFIENETKEIIASSAGVAISD